MRSILRWMWEHPYVALAVMTAAGVISAFLLISVFLDYPLSIDPSSIKDIGTSDSTHNIDPRNRNADRTDVLYWNSWVTTQRTRNLAHELFVPLGRFTVF